MIVVPDRLASLAFVKVFYAGPQFWMLHKKTEEALVDRQSFISKHVCSMVVQGEQHIYTEEGQKITIKAGQMAFICKGLYTVNDLLISVKKGEQVPSFEAYLLYFDDAVIDQIGPGSVEEPAMDFFRLESPAYLLDFWNGVEKLHDTFPNAGASLFELKLQEFFTFLHLVYPDIKSELAAIIRPQVKGIKTFMEKNFDKPLTIEDYAFLTGRSPSTFRRAFKLKFGTTPRQWIIQKRMDKALDLLKNRTIDVSQVALEVGYENVSHFISAFKKTHGYTPGQLSNTMLS